MYDEVLLTLLRRLQRLSQRKSDNFWKIDGKKFASLENSILMLPVLIEGTHF